MYLFRSGISFFLSRISKTRERSPTKKLSKSSSYTVRGILSSGKWLHCVKSSWYNEYGKNNNLQVKFWQLNSLLLGLQAFVKPNENKQSNETYFRLTEG